MIMKIIIVIFILVVIVLSFFILKMTSTMMPRSLHLPGPQSRFAVTVSLQPCPCQALSPPCFLVFVPPQMASTAAVDSNLVALFQTEHGRALQNLQAFSFFPENLPATRKQTEKKTSERQVPRKQPVSHTPGHRPANGKEKRAEPY